MVTLKWPLVRKWNRETFTGACPSIRPQSSNGLAKCTFRQDHRILKLKPVSKNETALSFLYIYNIHMRMLVYILFWKSSELKNPGKGWTKVLWRAILTCGAVHEDMQIQEECWGRKTVVWHVITCAYCHSSIYPHIRTTAEEEAEDPFAYLGVWRCRAFR